MNASHGQFATQAGVRKAPASAGLERFVAATLDRAGREPPIPPDLLRHWLDLESVAALPTQSPAFFAALSATLLIGAGVRVFAAADPAADADGAVAAILPLCRDPGHFARWRMAGAREVFEPGDALCRSPAAARALARRMARERRALSLDRVPAGSPFIADLRAAMRGRGLVSLRPAVPCPTIALDESWCEPESHFNAGRRSDFRRAARRADELGEVRFEVIAPDENCFDPLFEEAIAVELASWKQEAGTAIAANPAKQAFFDAFFRAEALAGRLRIAFMRIDGRAVAMQLALEWQGRFWLFKIGYDEAFGRCSPGTLLMLHTIGWAAQRGLIAYELMGNVESWIADLWTRDCHECLHVRTYPFGLRGAVALLADGAVWLRTRLAGSRAG